MALTMGRWRPQPLGSRRPEVGSAGAGKALPRSLKPRAWPPTPTTPTGQNHQESRLTGAKLRRLTSGLASKAGGLELKTAERITSVGPASPERSPRRGYLPPVSTSLLRPFPCPPLTPLFAPTSLRFAVYSGQWIEPFADDLVPRITEVRKERKVHLDG